MPSLTPSMRLAVITSYFPSSAQPWQGRTAFETLRLLAQQLDLRVFSPFSRYPPLLRPKNRPAGFDPSFRPADPDDRPPMNVEYLPFTALPVISRSANARLAARAVLPSVRRFNPDVILSYVIYPDATAAHRVAQSLGRPLVTVAIGSDLNRIPNQAIRTQIQETLREATLTTTVSADLGRTAVALGAPPDRTRTILNGCNLSIFHPQDRAAARQRLGVAQADASLQIVLYVGRLDLAKGLAELVDAAANLHAARPHLHTYLVGDGPAGPALQEQIRTRGAESYVHLHPAVAMPEVARWMAAADVVTLPSYREGCPNVIVEALAAGRPVVATDTGGIPELLDPTCGRLVPVRDSAALAKALEEALATSWNTEAIHQAHNRSWADVAQDMLALLTEAHLRSSSTQP